MRELVRGSVTWGVVEVNWILAPFVVLLASFSAYVAQLDPDMAFLNQTTSTDFIPGLLSPEKIFVSLALFNLLRVPLTNLPYAISLMIMVISCCIFFKLCLHVSQCHVVVMSTTRECTSTTT